MILSIVTPSYNQGSFLAETIESVLSQEGDFVLDYIIVDGGSTDDSIDIIKRYEALLQQGGWAIKCRGITYRWLSENDKGQTDALMKGFKMAEGGIFAWLCSDDTYLPDTLQIIASFFRDHPDTGLLYGDARYCDADGAVIGSYRTEEFDFDRLASFNYICQPSAFFRKDAFDAVGGLDETLHFAMDYDLWIRIGSRYPCRNLPHVMSHYRLHEESKTIRNETLRQNSEEGLQVAIKHYKWAPLTRVYATCNFLCRARLPRLLARSRTAVIAAAVPCALFRSLLLNRGIRQNDLKLLNRENFRKLFKSRLEVMTGNKDQR